MVKWLFLAMSVMMLVPALLLFYASKKAKEREAVLSQFEKVIPRAYSDIKPIRAQDKWLPMLYMRASVYFGFELKRKHLLWFAMGLLSLGLVCKLVWGTEMALLMVVAALVLFGFVLPSLRLRRRRRTMVEQIPIFIDQVLRSLSTGRSVEGAMRQVITETPEPLATVLEPVVRATDLGANFTEALLDATRLHGIKELGLIALAIRISNNYGSSPNGLLNSVMQMIRQREAAQRELSAMTGETKITAWVLSLTPILIVIYMLYVSPGYLDMMLSDPSGKIMFEVGLGMQVLGILVFWRMLKSV